MIYMDMADKQQFCPVHLVTNFASIPWIAEPIFDSVDFRIPGLMHEWLHFSNALPRAKCDGLV